MDINIANLVIQVIIALGTIGGVIATVRISNKRDKAEYRKILEKFGLSLNKTNEKLKMENDNLLSEISVLIVQNETTGKYRDKAYQEFIKADTHPCDPLCEAHKKLDEKRESFYENLRENDNKIMAYIKQIQENNIIIERNKVIW